MRLFVSAILAAAGRGSGSGQPNQNRCSCWASARSSASFEILERHQRIDEIVVALPSDLAWVRPPTGFVAQTVRIVDGGARRQDSVANAFARVSKSATVIVVHDAARPFATSGLFTRVIDAAVQGGAAIAAIQASDTVKQAATDDATLVARTIDRESIYMAQTPQAFTRDVLEDAMALGRESRAASDERRWLKRRSFGASRRWRADQYQNTNAA